MIGRCYGCRQTWKLDGAIMWTLCPKCTRPLKIIANKKEVQAALEAFAPSETRKCDVCSAFMDRDAFNNWRCRTPGCMFDPDLTTEEPPEPKPPGWCSECGGSGWCKKCGGFGNAN